MKYYKLKVCDVWVYYKVRFHENTFAYYIDDPKEISTFNGPEINCWRVPSAEKGWDFIVSHNKKNLKQITKEEAFIEIL